MNSSGTVVFAAELAGSTQSALYGGPLSNPQPLLNSGNPVSGHPGVVFSAFYQPILTDSGLIAMGAYVKGTGITSSNNQGLFTGSPAAPTMVVQTGMQAPGTALGTTFSSFEAPQFGGNGRFAMNSLNQIAFEGTLAGPAVTSANNQGVWATLPDDELVLVARAGDVVSIDGTQKTISAVTFLGNSNSEGLGTCFTDDGRIALDVTFTDSSQGLFSTSVPEPSPSLALLIGSVAALCRRPARWLRR